MIAWHEHDFADEERQRRIWQQQNTKIDFFCVLTWVSSALVAGALWYALIVCIAKVAHFLRGVL